MAEKKKESFLFSWDVIYVVQCKKKSTAVFSKENIAVPRQTLATPSYFVKSPTAVMLLQKVVKVFFFFFFFFDVL